MINFSCLELMQAMQSLMALAKTRGPASNTKVCEAHQNQAIFHLDSPKGSHSKANNMWDSLG